MMRRIQQKDYLMANLGVLSTVKYMYFVVTYIFFAGCCYLLVVQCELPALLLVHA
jgi:hypothetical protein